MDFNVGDLVFDNKGDLYKITKMYVRDFEGDYYWVIYGETEDGTEDYLTDRELTLSQRNHVTRLKIDLNALLLDHKILVHEYNDEDWIQLKSIVNQMKDLIDNIDAIR